MRINILSTVGHKPGGLNRILLEHANQLALNGHQVKVIKPVNSQSKLKSFHGKAKQFAYFGFKPELKPYRCSWLRCAATFFKAPFCADQHIPDADVTIFSSLKMIEQVASLSSSKGKKIILIQDPHYVQSPLSIPENITVVAASSSIKNKLKNWLSNRKIYLLVNGINLELFSNPDKLFRPAETVGMIWYNKKPKHKGVGDGIAAFEKAREKYPRLTLKMAGLKPENGIPAYANFIKGFNQDKLADFYSSIDIFLYPSHLDACALPPMEAMACKAALVATDVGGVCDYTNGGETALVSAPKDVDKLAANVVSLVENPDKLKEIALSGYEKIKEFSWENQTNKLENIFKDLEIKN